ncbi:hypothetical protein [Crenalkalicoccus roseus]|uniref:hypothetical protein n=1 Tax=Crenalkalicoccus roseus TaxID=1485588 RepID=UPI00107FE6A5|nr:hypothetical protein [Crenalkalicoccus roseus]
MTRARTAGLLALIPALLVPRAAPGLAITINGVTLTAPPGEATIPLAGTCGAPQPGLPRLFVVDTPFFKGLGMTDFALVGPPSANPFFCPFNAHGILIEHDVTPFPRRRSTP